MIKKGFTLIEIIIAMALASIIVATVYSIFDTSNSVFNNVTDKVRIQDEGNNITRKIQKDIVNSTSVSSVNNQLSIQKTDGSIVTYNLSNGMLFRNSDVISTMIKDIYFNIKDNYVYFKFNSSLKQKSYEFSSVIDLKNWRVDSKLDVLSQFCFMVKSTTANMSELFYIQDSGNNVWASFKYTLFESNTDSLNFINYQSQSFGKDVYDMVNKGIIPPTVIYKKNTNTFILDTWTLKDNLLPSSGNIGISLVNNDVLLKPYSSSPDLVLSTPGSYKTFTMNGYNVLLVDGDLTFKCSKNAIYNFNNYIIIVTGKISFQNLSGNGSNVATYNFNNTSVYSYGLNLYQGSNIVINGAAFSTMGSDSDRTAVFNEVSKYIN